MESAMKSDRIAGRILSGFSDWLWRLYDDAGSRGLRPGDVDLIAQDLRVSRAELETLVSRGRQTADELPKLLASCGIVESELAREEPGVLRDMTLVCSLCVAKSRCNRELKSGSATHHIHEYCANAFAIDALKALPRRQKPCG
ncbi:hypothetical protein [Bradyrhizobium monzae]|uniref:hypothetical protein n=1 Tax=Bradyrhizobium sp. Oc8 TaxID=2876780 RepID=UPI001F39D230|nr:hypothetical protein [Bradyrhizobium sp. Oc8]